MGIGGKRKQNVENLVYKSSLLRILSTVNKLQLPNFFKYIFFKQRFIRLLIYVQFCVGLTSKNNLTCILKENNSSFQRVSS